MQLQENKLQYIEDERIFSFQDTLLENISFKVFVECDTEKFLQYQKDILEDFVAEFTSVLKNAEAVDINDVKTFFEESLQILNTKLKQFAEKVRDIERFQLKGLIQLVIEEALMSSMIGEVTLMIMRDERVLYTLSNGIDARSKIDVFSDFIEGALERGDQVMYIGTKISDVMDQHDRKEMEEILASEENQEGAMYFLEDLLTTRVDKESIGFIVNYAVLGPIVTANRRAKGRKNAAILNTASYLEDLGAKIHNSDLIKKFKKQLLGNRYYVIGVIL